MSTNYQKIIGENLLRIYSNLPEVLEKALPARREGNRFYFRAFGEDCCLGPKQITLSGRPETGPKGLLISLYATHVNDELLKLEPLKSFKDLPGSMPYQGAFTVNSEKVLVPHVLQIKGRVEIILSAFSGKMNPPGGSGDFSFLLYPLPKIGLCYIFYLPDEEFTASVTCLFSGNALSFMPLDGLADVAEYTSKTILFLIKGNLK
jgi:hypothetical protein